MEVVHVGMLDLEDFAVAVEVCCSCSCSAGSYAVEMAETLGVEAEAERHIVFGRRSTGVFLVDTLKGLSRIA